MVAVLTVTDVLRLSVGVSGRVLITAGNWHSCQGARAKARLCSLHPCVRSEWAAVKFGSWVALVAQPSLPAGELSLQPWSRFAQGLSRVGPRPEGGRGLKSRHPLSAESNCTSSLRWNY